MDGKPSDLTPIDIKIGPNGYRSEVRFAGRFVPVTKMVVHVDALDVTRVDLELAPAAAPFETVHVSGFLCDDESVLGQRIKKLEEELARARKQIAALLQGIGGDAQ